MTVRGVLLISIFCLLCPGTIYSQWTAEDSLWLKEVLSNRKELRLKPEVQELIRQGHFLNLEKNHFGTQPKNAPIQLPLARDFSSYIQFSDSSLSKVDYSRIPPSVFMLYGKESGSIVRLKSFSLAGIENYQANRSAPLVITDPLMKGQASGGVVYLICINDIVDFFISRKRSK